MAVKLILVVLLVAVVSTNLAQQASERSGSEDTVGTDRRLGLRRFQNRNRNRDSDTEVKETRRQQPRRLANQDKIAERRRELLQRNGVSRRRKVVPANKNEIAAVEPTKRPEVRIKLTTEAAIEDETPVERITNNNQDIINAVLDNNEEEKTPFSGTSEVRTLNSPSGFRSSNEQIVRISFKKTTEAPKIEETEAPARRFKPKKGFRKGLFNRGRFTRPSTEAPSTTEAIQTTTKVVLLSQASDALKALLKTANEPVETKNTVTNEVEEKLPEEAEAAVLEM